MKILTIVGARPQFVKSAAISKEFQLRGINEIIVHTGQHYDKNMSKIFFDELNIPKEKYNLDINQLSHGAMTGRMMEKIESILCIEKPDYLLVYGDTNSTLAGAVAASKLHIDIIHIEAGLRSFNRRMPEEINRVITDNLSKFLFCPSSESVKNLDAEGINNSNSCVHIVGDIMKDTVELFNNSLKKQNKSFDIFVTIHREENITNRQKLSSIISALNHLSKDFSICFPIHPSTQNWIKKLDLKLDFKTIEPLSFTETLSTIKQTKLVITDSGGLQKEAYYLKRPSLIVREQTEWIEMLQEDVNTLCPANYITIIDTVNLKIGKNYKFNESIYGEGNSAKKICDVLLSNGG